MRKIIWSAALAGGAWFIMTIILLTFEPAYGEIIKWTLVVVIGLVGWVAASPRLGKDATRILAELKKWSGATDAELKGEFSWDEFQFQAALKELQSHLGDELLIKKRGGWSEYSLKNKKRK